MPFCFEQIHYPTLTSALMSARKECLLPGLSLVSGFPCVPNLLYLPSCVAIHGAPHLVPTTLNGPGGRGWVVFR